MLWYLDKGDDHANQSRIGFDGCIPHLYNCFQKNARLSTCQKRYSVKILAFCCCKHRNLLRPLLPELHWNLNCSILANSVSSKTSWFNFSTVLILGKVKNSNFYPWCSLHGKSPSQQVLLNTKHFQARPYSSRIFTNSSNVELFTNFPFSLAFFLCKGIWKKVRFFPWKRSFRGYICRKEQFSAIFWHSITLFHLTQCWTFSIGAALQVCLFTKMITY